MFFPNLSQCGPGFTRFIPLTGQHTSVHSSMSRRTTSKKLTEDISSVDQPENDKSATDGTGVLSTPATCDVLTLVMTMNVLRQQPVTVTLNNANICSCRVLDSAEYHTRNITARKVIVEPAGSLTVNSVNTSEMLMSFQQDKSVQTDVSHGCLYGVQIKEEVVGLGSRELSIEEVILGPALNRLGLDHFGCEQDDLKDDGPHPSKELSTEQRVGFTSKSDVDRRAIPSSSEVPHERDIDFPADDTFDMLESKPFSVRKTRAKRTSVTRETTEKKKSQPSRKMGQRHQYMTRKSSRTKQNQNSVLWKDCKIWNKVEFRNENIFNCYLCDVQFPTADTLSNHLVNAHKPEVALNSEGAQTMLMSFAKRLEDADHAKCILCDYSCDSITDFQTHVWQNHLQGMSKLTEAPKERKVPSSDELSEYIKEADNGTWTCTVCQYTRPGLLNLKIHVRRLHLRKVTAAAHHKSTKTKRGPCEVICTVCGHRLRSKYLLKDHHATHHEPDHEKGHTCSVCGKVFHTRNQVSAHERRVHGPSQPCPIPGCGAVLKRDSLKYHVQSKHLQRGKPYACEVCQKVFTSRAHAKGHEKNVHQGNKTHVCDWPECGKAFATPWTLRVHRHTHTGDKPFQCELCGFMSRQKNGLNYHLKVSHPKETNTPD